MGYDKFSTIVANHFEEIKRNFKKGLKNSEYDWDEDVFMDAYIKCDEVLKDKVMDKKEAVSYFWTAYLNKIKNGYKYEIFDELPDDYDEVEEVYNIDKDLFCNLLYERVSEKFGPDIAKAWVEHRAFGKTIKEISQEYSFQYKFEYILKRIRTYIKDDLMNDPYVKERYNNMFSR